MRTTSRPSAPRYRERSVFFPPPSLHGHVLWLLLFLFLFFFPPQNGKEHC
uniref:Uncharacterized protein n=1 Tax=Anguilla anguilla TaxID=7936 RepID=A0A0E9TS83_ANGAN